MQRTVKFGGGSLMILGCISMHIVGNLVRIDGTLDVRLYCKILEQDVQSSVGFYGDKLKNFIFQHDNGPKHTSKMVTKWLVDNEIEVLEWPAQFLDLNLTEHLWSHQKRRLAAYDSVSMRYGKDWKKNGIIFHHNYVWN